MNTAVINVKVDPKLKRQAQAVAGDLGFSLSSLINAYLRQVVRDREVGFSDVRLELTPYAKRMLKQSEKDIKEGYVSPGFTKAEDAIAWLDDPHAEYKNGASVR